MWFCSSCCFGILVVGVNFLLLSAGAPEIIKQDNTDIEERLEETVDLSCFARGFPAPSITWTTSDGKVRQGEACFFHCVLTR